MTTIAVLGLGAMGSRMALNLLRAGHTVTVWNRTEKAAEELVAAGASFAATPKEAATGAAIVLSMVRDDAASGDVWLHPQHGAFAGMNASSIAIESSTVSHEWVLDLGQAARARGLSLIDAPVSGSRPQAEAGQLVFLVGGEAAAVEAAREVLQAMGSSIHHVGALGAGALVKLATNALLGVQVTTLAELFGILGAHGVDLGKAFEAVGATSVSSIASQRSAASMTAGNFAPQFPVALIEKDFGYAVSAAGGAAAAPTIEAARQVFSSASQQGLGELNMTSVVKLFAR
ncbi:3-hydroxyisobutyrate dehydrogenase [Pseudomonas sp. Ost2]|uniref:NAD(P)-dependent oxidoreductase n=1 Tax=Pseudomonas TaxID=286 RepID=UPI0015A2C5F2|nr:MULTISPECIES: NAD(P)-dependent oxidoreductase [Pseudomonas]NWA11026.1 NAD(P)-dependent oxidoreductase [Pseudomonas gingeri]BBP76744.1 3-hydroxyisobutyrate dehydrogenase [Pseudomonas sp. Ost2]